MNKPAVFATLALAFFSISAQAADPAAGQKQYDATCIACHGAGGIAVAPIYPNLNGQKEQYLTEQLKAFRAGTRKNPIMEPMAKNLTDAEIANLSAFLSQLNSK